MLGISRSAGKAWLYLSTTGRILSATCWLMRRMATSFRSFVYLWNASSISATDVYCRAIMKTRQVQVQVQGRTSQAEGRTGCDENTHLVVDNDKILLALLVYVADTSEQEARCRVLPVTVSKKWIVCKGRLGAMLTSSAMSAMSVLSEACCDTDMVECWLRACVCVVEGEVAMLSADLNLIPVGEAATAPGQRYNRVARAGHPVDNSTRAKRIYTRRERESKARSKPSLSCLCPKKKRQRGRERGTAACCGPAFLLHLFSCLVCSGLAVQQSESANPNPFQVAALHPPTQIAPCRPPCYPPTLTPRTAPALLVAPSSSPVPQAAPTHPASATFSTRTSATTTMGPVIP